MDLPVWVRKHKVKGTEVRNFDGKYYLYKIHSVRDKEKGRPKKVTDKYLGRITPDGLIKPKHERVLEGLKDITVKEYGATNYLMESNKEIIKLVKRAYPDRWKEIVSFAVFRFMYNSPIKNLSTYYATSYLSETLKDASMSPKPISELLRDIGSKRKTMTRFLRGFVRGHEFMVIDGTHILSSSEGVDSTVPGYNSKRVFDPQVRLMLIHSLDNHMPAYFRFLTGSLTDVSAVTLTVKEAGIKNSILIGDKGFYSEDNVKNLKKQHVKYILPLKRNSTLIDYVNIESGDKRNLGGCFLFQNRSVWYDKHKLKGKHIILFLDEKLKAEEERSFIIHVEGKKKTMDEFYEKQHRRGTIAVITDYKEDPQKIYELLKRRLEIEQVIDTFKNTLKADRTYMRDDYQMEGWMLINFISLLLHYKTYGLLIQKKLLHKYSPKDVLMHLSRIHKLKINDKWTTSEIPKKSRVLIEKLDMRIT
jgi:transposase